MNRVLLLLDDYSELMFIQIILKKLGFDVDTLQNHHILGDRILSFRPNLLILTEDSRKMSSEFVLNQSRAQIPELKSILLRKDVEGVERVSPETLRISRPVQPIELIKATGECCQMPTDDLIEKFKKFRGQLKELDGEGAVGSSADLEVEDELTFVASAQSMEQQEPSTRATQYKDYLQKQQNSVTQSFSPQEVSQVVKKDRTADQKSKKIDMERKRFATELFKKAKGKNS